MNAQFEASDEIKEQKYLLIELEGCGEVQVVKANIASTGVRMRTVDFFLCCSKIKALKGQMKCWHRRVLKYQPKRKQF